MRWPRRVNGFAITGYAVCSSVGATVAESRRALSEGTSPLRPPPVELPFATVCGVVDPDLPAVTGSLRAYDGRLGRMVTALADELDPAITAVTRRFGASRVAAVLGTSTGGLAETERAWRAWRSSGALPGEDHLAKRHAFHAAVDLLRARYAFGGPGYVLSTACSSGGKVFASAQRLIDAGLADAVLVGAVDTLCETTLRGFHALGILSPTPCRPFARDRDGLNLGEGGALFVVARDGDGPARLLGVGESSDGYHMSSPHPEGLGAKAAMRAALERAGVAPDEVDYVNAHGTGTARNDEVEAEAIAEVFGVRVPVASTKGQTGHTLGAAGAIEAAFSIAAIEEGVIPESLRARPLDPRVRVNVTAARREARVRRVLSNSFGFGGSNASVLLGAP